MKRNSFAPGAMAAALSVVALLGLSGCATAPAPVAEKAPARPEVKTMEQLEAEGRAAWEAYKDSLTWEERLAALDLKVDPGPDPDPAEVYSRMGEEFTIQRFDKKFASFTGVPVGYVRPQINVSFVAPIYRDDEEFVWVLMPHRSEERRQSFREQEQLLTHGTPRNLDDETMASLLEHRKVFVEIDPPRVDRAVTFSASSEGLPDYGSWRNSGDVADMNGDGHLDIVAPPQRGGGLGSLLPTIFLGDGQGNWTVWNEMKSDRTFDYGAVRAADFNGDGHMDLALGIHLQGVAVILGDGQGGFKNSSRGIELDFVTRRIEVADFDLDGDPDIVALMEGPTPNMDDTPAALKPKMRVYRNHKKGTLWQPYDVGEPERLHGGDWLAVGQFNDDPRPDIITSSNFMHGTDMVWLSAGEMKWEAFGRGFFPWYSYAGDVEAANFMGGARDEAVVSYTRYWPELPQDNAPAPPDHTAIAGIELVSWEALEPVRKTIMQWSSGFTTRAMAAGDLDLDGHQDVLLLRSDDNTMVVLFGDGNGRFARGEVAGVEVRPNPAYELKLADLDLDGDLDLILFYEDSGTRFGLKDGSVRVYLNQVR